MKGIFRVQRHHLLFLLPFILLLPVLAAAQEHPLPDTSGKEVKLPDSVKVFEEDNDVFVVVEEMPEFPGGDNARLKYLADNIRYPLTARQAGISGTVFATFVVEKNGSLNNIKIIKGIGAGCDEEVIRVIQSMPKWKPGKQRGQVVRVQYNLPVKFLLSVHKN